MKTICKRRLWRSDVLQGPCTWGAQVSGTAPPLAGGAAATTPLECGTRAARDRRALSAALALPRPASGPGVSRLGWRRPPLCVLGSDPGPRVQVSEPLLFLASHRCPRWYWEFDPSCRLGCRVRAGGREWGRPLRFWVDSTLARELDRPGYSWLGTRGWSVQRVVTGGRRR